MPERCNFFDIDLARPSTSFLTRMFMTIIGDRKLKVKDEGILIHRTFNFILIKDP
jgi:hypothetical protein